MIKHPALRIASISDCDPKFLKEFTSELETFGSLTPFAEMILDFEVMGSYACDRARLPSDLDINISCGDRRDEARKLIIENPEAWRKAVRFIKEISIKYGIRIEPSLKYPSGKDVINERCFSLREMKMYGTHKDRVPHLSIGVVDEHGNAREYDPKRDTLDMIDPWFNDLPEWEKKYGDKLLKFGETPETAWMK